MATTNFKKLKTSIDLVLCATEVISIHMSGTPFIGPICDLIAEQDLAISLVMELLDVMVELRKTNAVKDQRPPER